MNLPPTQLQEKTRVTHAVPPELEEEEKDEAWFSSILSPDMI